MAFRSEAARAGAIDIVAAKRVSAKDELGPALERAALMALWLALATFVPQPGLAAIPACNVRSASAVAPAGMMIGKVSDLALKPLPGARDGVTYVPANGFGDGAPEYCLITGKVVTNPKTRKTANFAVVLPSKSRWNGKFLFEGCGGFCGQMKFWGPPAAAQLEKGFPVWITDDGHRGKEGPSARFPPGDDPSWGTAGSARYDRDAVIDYEYRAVHTVTRLGKLFTQRFYERRKLDRSYFVGCSDGGREAMVELTKYPSDYDGIVAGAPFFDMTNQLVTSTVGIAAQLRSPGAAVPLALLRALDRIMDAKCDATDGVRDGLIQNPARCNFDPERDLPICGKARSSEACFTPEQADSLDIIFSATYDGAGRVLFPGFDISNPGYELGKSLAFAGPATDPGGDDPWGGNPADQPLGWYMGKGILDDLLQRKGTEASLRALRISFKRDVIGGASDLHAVIPDEVVASLQAEAAPGSGVSPSAARAFLNQGRKLILYHGLSDGLITPYRTVQYYRALARLYGGYSALQSRAELFLVPGMGHCGGGPGPNYFGQFFRQQGPSGDQPLDARDDVVSALDQWVSEGKRPMELIATKYAHDVIGSPIMRKMPLCPFPEEASYRRAGNPHGARAWFCPRGDTRLEEFGSAGVRAGANAPLRFLANGIGRTHQPH